MLGPPCSARHPELGRPLHPDTELIGFDVGCEPDGT